MLDKQYYAMYNIIESIVNCRVWVFTKKWEIKNDRGSRLLLFHPNLCGKITLLTIDVIIFSDNFKMDYFYTIR